MAWYERAIRDSELYQIVKLRKGISPLIMLCCTIICCSVTYRSRETYPSYIDTVLEVHKYLLEKVFWSQPIMVDGMCSILKGTILVTSELFHLTSWLCCLFGTIFMADIISTDIVKFTRQFLIQFEKTRKLRYPCSANATKSSWFDLNLNSY